MKKNKIKVFCTIGPSSLNKDFLSYTEKNKNLVSLVRINLSHVGLDNLKKYIKFIKKYTSVPICIDTEGAQIRTKIKTKKVIKKNKKFKLNKKGDFTFYPPETFDLLKKGDILNIGFSGLKAKIIKKIKNDFELLCMSEGYLENNKGVHIENRRMRLRFITKKDEKCIKLGLTLGIKNFALSFTNSTTDIKKFQKILPTQNKIFKIETNNAVKNIDLFFKKEKNFLIDRGDLSKSTGIEKIPVIQRNILKKSKKYGAKIAVATNFLESMIENSYPTRAEVNDIYNTIEMGAKFLVLAAETAIGKYPKDCIILLKKIIKEFKKEN